MDNLPLLQAYDLVIVGDVLEHLTIVQAQMLVTYLDNRKIPSIFSIPYNWPQSADSDEVLRNKYEFHKQDDLCREVIAARYPQLMFLFEITVGGMDGSGMGLYTIAV